MPHFITQNFRIGVQFFRVAFGIKNEYNRII